MKTWDDCVDFHGHVCGGLTIGYKAALYASELLELKFSDDEQLVCVAENNSCSVDGIQVILGCTIGKGNLLFKLRGKQAFSFFNRTTGKAIRLVMKDLPKFDRDQAHEIMMNMSNEDLFEVKDVTVQLPEKARIFMSVACDNCGEKTAENMLRCEGGQKLCMDCFHPYERFCL